MRRCTLFHARPRAAFTLLVFALLPWLALFIVCVSVLQSGKDNPVLRIGSVDLGRFDVSILALGVGVFTTLEVALLAVAWRAVARWLTTAFVLLFVLSTAGTIYSTLCAIDLLTPTGFTRNWVDAVRALFIAGYSAWMAWLHMSISRSNVAKA